MSMNLAFIRTREWCISRNAKRLKAEAGRYQVQPDLNWRVGIGGWSVG